MSGIGVRWWWTFRSAAVTTGGDRRRAHRNGAGHTGIKLPALLDASMSETGEGRGGGGRGRTVGRGGRRGGGREGGGREVGGRGRGGSEAEGGGRGRGRDGGRGGGGGRGRGREGGGRGDDASGGRRGRGSRGGGSGGRKQQVNLAARQEQERQEQARKEQEQRERWEREEAEQRAKEIADRLAALQESKVRIEDATRAARTKRQLRVANLSPDRPGEEKLRVLDSSVKRNTALIKRLRQVGEDGHESLCEDLRKVNQSKYVSEAVQAICEAPIKPRDIGAVVQVCSVLHQRYAEFSSNLVSSMAAVFGTEAKSSEDISLAKRRNTLRLLAEMYLCGLYGDLNILLDIVRGLVPCGGDGGDIHTSLTLLSSLAKSNREELLGLQRRAAPTSEDTSVQAFSYGNTLGGCYFVTAGGEEVESLVNALAELRSAELENEQEMKQAYVLPENHAKGFAQAMSQAYSIGCKALAKEHKVMLRQEKANADMLATKGELSEEAAANYEKARRDFDALQRTISTLSEALEREMPDLPGLEPEPTPEEQALPTSASSAHTSTNPEDEPSQIFDDEDTRAFYESLPDLRSLVPAVLLGDAKHDKGDDDKSKEEGEEGAAAEDPQEGGSGNQLEMLLLRLPTCVSRDLSDEFSLNFCYLNSKGARKKLIKSLVEVPRGASQLLPYYARVTATLSPVFPDVSQGVLLGLEQKIHPLLAKRDQSTSVTEKLICYMGYVGELCKFRLTPYGTIFSLFKVLLDNFAHSNIDAMCALLETAGRFLYKNPETSVRMINMLKIMMRIKTTKNLDIRQSSLVDSAYYECCPPVRSAAPVKTRSPEQEWIRHLVYDQLRADSVQKVMKKLRKLPWAEYEPYLVKCLLKVSRCRFSQVPLVASLAAGLSKYHDTLGVSLVDTTLELVYQGLERPQTGRYQKRVGQIRLLGEMYNYRLVDSRIIFDTLRLIVSFNQTEPGADAAEQEALEHMLFRVRLVCTLLDCCGRYFDRGTSKRRLDQFLVLFQHFCLWISPLPLDVEFEVDDLFAKLRPAMSRFSTLEEAAEALQRQEQGSEAQGGAEATGVGGDEAAGEDEDIDSNISDGDSNAGSVEEGEVGGSAADTEMAEVEDTEDAVEVQDSDGANEDDEVTVKRPVVEQEIDEDFEAQYLAVMQEAAGNRKGPMFQGSAPAAPVLQVRQAAGGKTTGGKPPESAAVSFRLLLKRGGREDKSRELHVPVDAAMAVNARMKEEAEAQERSQIKRLVLEANKREEEEMRAAERAARWQQARQSAAAGRGQEPQGRGGD